VTESIAQLIENLDANWAGFFIFALAFLEACPGIGLFITGALLLATATGLYANGALDLPYIMLAAFLGALVSDHLGYYLGRWMGPHFHHSRFAKKHNQRINRAEALFQKHGAAAIVIGRLVPAIRSITPLFTGISGLSNNRFSLVDVLACLLWAAGLGALTSGITLAIG
jgi:membrane-associated protein